MFIKLLLFLFVQSSAAVIHSFNDPNNARVPPLFYLDNYEECFNDPDAMYCFAEMFLVSDDPKDLLTVVPENLNSLIHYNYTLLRHGYCMKKTCKKFFNASGSELDQKSSLEACANETIYNQYKLKTIVSDVVDCFKRDRNQPIDYVDMSVGAICVVILMLNLIGSFCDYYLKKGTNCAGLRFLYCFSLYRNWKKLVSIQEGQDSRLKALKGFHGIRSINTCLVLLGHSFLICIVFVANPTFIESLYRHPFFIVILNGTLIMQTFLIISSFLLVYNWLIYSEEHEILWKMLPKQIILRWLRLTPSYAVILALSATWFSRLASGPYWKKYFYYEARDCRDNWWKHLFYMNNYYGTTNCMPHTWYLAADTQLYYVGVLIFLMCRTSLSRKVVLSIFFVAGMIAPVLHTYYQSVNGVMIGSLESVLNFCLEDPTFNKLFIKAHNNLTGYVIGMALGYIIYYWQKAGGSSKQFQKYRYLYWSTFFLGLLCHYSGSIFYIDGPPLPTYVHVLYAALLKPIFGIIVGIVIAGMIIQFEGLYRTILEWRPFTFTSRLSYSAYLVHALVIRTDIASMIALQEISFTRIFLKSCTTVTVTYIAAFFIWMLVETPFANLIGAFFEKPGTHTDEQKKEAVQESKKTK